MLVQHNMTVITVFDHEKNYEEICNWLKERCDMYVIKHGIVTYMNPIIENMFYQKFYVEIK